MERRIGYRIKSNRTFYVSPGHKVDFDSMMEFFKVLGYGYPKALETADRLSKGND